MKPFMQKIIAVRYSYNKIRRTFRLDFQSSVAMSEKSYTTGSSVSYTELNVLTSSLSGSLPVGVDKIPA